MNGSLAYVQRSIDAVVRLALRDTGALSRLDLTADGFFLSFTAMIVGAPLFATALAGWRYTLISVVTQSGHKLEAADVEFGPVHFALAVLMYLLLWSVFPVAALLMLRFLRQTERYSALIIAFNWSAVLLLLLFNVPFVLFALGAIDGFVTFAILFTIFGFALYYRFFLAGATLQSDSSTAMAIAAVNVILFFFIIFGVDALGGLLSG